MMDKAITAKEDALMRFVGYDMFNLFLQRVLLF